MAPRGAELCRSDAERQVSPGRQPTDRPLARCGLLQEAAKVAGLGHQAAIFSACFST
jgi:hypothetical protein